MAQLKLIDTIQSKLEEVSQSDGQLILEKDGKNLYFDFNGDRINISDFIELESVNDLDYIFTPLPDKFYFIKENVSLWRYINDEWNCIVKNNNILMEREFNNVIAEDSIMYYGCFRPIDFNIPWTIKFRIYAEVADTSGATQYADIFLSGVGENLGTFETKNVIYDLGLKCISNNILYLLNKETYITDESNKNYLGIDLLNTNESYNRTIKVEIYETTNCVFDWAGTEAMTASRLGISALDYSKTIYINFNENGEFTNNLVNKEELSEVAFTGSYNDLKDKPSLLEVKIDDEFEDLLTFYKE
jgi:hypothetical protein